MTKRANDPHQVLQEDTDRAAEGWRRHPAVRAAVTNVSWRDLAAVALEDLDHSVGTLDQIEISWLVSRTLGQREWYPDGTSWPDPKWSTDPRARAAGIKLLRVVTALAKQLRREGVPLDPEGLTDRLVLAQLLTHEGLLDAPDGVAALNLGAIMGVSPDGRLVWSDGHARDSTRRAMDSLSARLLDKVPTVREGIYDEALRALLAHRPTVKPDAILRACWAREPWAQPLWSMLSDDDVDVSTIRRALKRIRGVTTKQ